MTEKINLRHLNETYIRIDAERSTVQEIADYFTFLVPDYQFMPSYKYRRWDGKISLVDRRNQTTYKGLVPEIIAFAAEKGYECVLDEALLSSYGEETRNHESVSNLLRELKLPPNKPLRDFQIRAIIDSVVSKRGIVISATGSGKSMVIYCICRWLMDHTSEKILLVVPTVNLVNQMMGDFNEYGHYDSTWSKDFVHGIYGGKEKINHVARVFVSTWQSIYRLPRAYFEQFIAVLGDECHLMDSSCVSSVAEKASKAKYKIGFTGTLSEDPLKEMTLTGLFGPPILCATSKELQDRGILAKLRIRNLALKYSEKEAAIVRKLDYRGEIDYVVSSPKRLKFLTQLGTEMNGNMLILVSLIEKHGMPLYQALKKFAKTKQVFFVHGSTDPLERERIRKMVEKRNDMVIVASYGVMSTGANMVNLHNVVFGAPSKSKIRVLQSIGRGLRKGGDKQSVDVIDIIDDFSGETETNNYLLDHFEERLRYYKQEGFEYTTHELKF